MPFRETPWVRSEEGALAFRASEDRVRRLPLRELLLDPAILDNRFPGERLAHNFACVAELSFVRRHEQKGIAEPTLRCAAPHQSIECCVSGGGFRGSLARVHDRPLRRALLCDVFVERGLKVARVHARNHLPALYFVAFGDSQFCHASRKLGADINLFSF